MLAPAAAAPQKTELFRINDPIFLMGIVLYIANRTLDLAFNLPVFEIFLPVLLFGLVIKEKNLANIRGVRGLVLFAAFIMWVILSNIVNQVPATGQVRNIIALLTLFLPVFFFAQLNDRHKIMTLIIGVVAGFGLWFLYLSGSALLDGNIPRSLRGGQPTPVVALAIWALLHKQMTRNLSWLMLFLVAANFMVAIAIDARGPLLSVPMALAIFVAARFSPFPRLSIPAVIAAGFIAHWVMSSFVASSFDLVVESGKDTVSNMERASAIDYCRMVLASSPWFGNSPQNFAIDFADYFNNFAAEADLGDNVKTPHNSFLEYSTFFGYPAGILFTLLVCRLVYAALPTRDAARAFFVACVAAGLIRMGAFYGFSGWLRVEWFALIFLMYYAYLQPPAYEREEK